MGPKSFINAHFANENVFHEKYLKLIGEISISPAGFRPTSISLSFFFSHMGPLHDEKMCFFGQNTLKLCKNCIFA
jgi:hypothetical protein